MEPVSVADLKSYLRIDTSSDDTMLAAFQITARELIESYTGRRLITQTWDYWLDSFPSTVRFDNLMPEGVTEGKLSEFLSVSKHLQIPLMPLQSVTYLNTYPDDGVAVLMDADEYIVDTVHEPGRVSLKTSTNWPTTYLRPVNGVQVRFVCGYGAAGTDVPSAIIQAIKELVGKFYNDRACSDTSFPSIVTALLRPYKIMRIG